MFEDQFVNESMLDIFIFETSQLIEKLEESVICNEEDNRYSEAQINEIFRIMHTIKGSASMMMFGNISELAHAMEDLFYYIREEKPVHMDYSALTDVILACIDDIKLEIEKIRNHDKADGIFRTEIEDVKKLLKRLKAAKDGKDKAHHYQVRLFFEDGCEMENIRAFSVVQRLKEICLQIRSIPENPENSNESTELIKRDGFNINLETEHSYEEICDFFRNTEFLRDVDIKEAEEENEDFRLKGLPEANTDNKWEKKENREEGSISLQQSIISVSVNKLDKLMDLVGEMVISQAMVIHNPDLQGMELTNFHKAAGQLTKITDEMQDLVMAIRMVPLSVTFHKMHRIVRDISKKLGKEMQLKIIGEETEVDKNIIEQISDPLMHLVRNAADHGIEDPADRQRSGKPRQGTVTLEAKNVGGDVLILIKDDGKGLDKEKIVEKAKSMGLLTNQERDMTDKEIYQLLFLPGFSTNSEVTEYSGRGVGMDVVTRNIEKLGGSVSMDSTWQQGTCVTLKIPLTLAIIDGIQIKVGKTYFTIPTIAVKEFFRPDKKDVLQDPENNEFIMVRGECYSVIRLENYYHVKEAVKKIEDGIIIMVEQEGKSICLFADELLGQQQVVVKPLPDFIKYFNKLKTLTGCTLLGDGNISLILDVSGLF